MVLDRIQPSSAAFNRIQPTSTELNRIQPNYRFSRFQPSSTEFDRPQPSSTEFNRIQPNSTEFEFNPRSNGIDWTKRALAIRNLHMSVEIGHVLQSLHFGHCVFDSPAENRMLTLSASLLIFFACCTSIYLLVYFVSTICCPSLCSSFR